MADRLTRPDAKREFALVAAEPLPPAKRSSAPSRARRFPRTAATLNSPSSSATTSRASAWAGT
jgi:hypothetical protein